MRPRDALLQARGGALDLRSEAGLLGQHVGGAAGDNGRGTAECNMPSAASLMVPSPPAATIRSAPRPMCSRANGARGSPAPGGDHRQVVAVVAEDSGHAPDQRFPVPSELAA